MSGSYQQSAQNNEEQRKEMKEEVNKVKTSYTLSKPSVTINCM